MNKLRFGEKGINIRGHVQGFNIFLEYADLRLLGIPITKSMILRSWILANKAKRPSYG
jgi:hypothetical protein